MLLLRLGGPVASSLTLINPSCAQGGLIDVNTFVRRAVTMAQPKQKMSSEETVTMGDGPHRSDRLDMPALPRAFVDGSLLFRHMSLLRIDRGELAQEDPLLFRELQGLCALCRNKEECAEDLRHKFDDARWHKWWDYCPNSSMLGQIRAVQAATRTYCRG